MWWIAGAAVLVVVAVVVWRRWEGRNSGAGRAHGLPRHDGTHTEAETYAALHRNQTWSSGGPF